MLLTRAGLAMRHNGDTLRKIRVKMKRNEIDPAPEGVCVHVLPLCVRMHGDVCVQWNCICYFQLIIRKRCAILVSLYPSVRLLC